MLYPAIEDPSDVDLGRAHPLLDYPAHALLDPQAHALPAAVIQPPTFAILPGFRFEVDIELTDDGVAYFAQA